MNASELAADKSLAIDRVECPTDAVAVPAGPAKEPWLSLPLEVSARVALSVLLVSVVLFAIIDLASSPSRPALVLAKLAQVLVALTALRVLPRLTTTRAVRALLLVSGSSTCLLIATVGVLNHDVARVAILCLTLTWSAAAMIPWGATAQLGFGLFAGTAVMASARLVHADLPITTSYPAIAAFLAAPLSALLAYSLDQRRSIIARAQASRRLEHETARRNQADLQAIFANLEDIFFRVGLDGTIHMLSPSVARYGYSVDELVGSKTTLLYADAEVHAQNMAELMKHGSLRDIELPLIAKDGRVVPCSENVHLYYDDQGRPIGMEGVLRDISERKQAENELRRAHELLERRVEERTETLRKREEQLRLITDNMFDLLSRVSLQGIYEYVSPAHERMLGYPVEAMLGRSVFSFVHPEDAEEVSAAMLAGLKAGRTPRMEFRWRHADGHYLWLEATAKFLYDANGRSSAAVVSGRDITDRKRAEERTLEFQRAQQEEAAVSAALARVGQEMISSFDNAELMQRLCRVTTEVLGCDCSYTTVWYPEDDAYRIPAVYGIGDEDIESVRALKLPAYALVELIDEIRGQEVFQLEPAHAKTTWGSVPALYGVNRVMYVLLRRGDDVIGIHGAGFRGREQEFSPLQERIAREIAALASVGLENARLVQELERASNLKSEFLATMSHELRTPLSVITGYTGLLLDREFGPLSEAQRETLERVGANAGELLDMINATLDMSRLETGRVPVQWCEVHMSELLRQVAAETRDVQKQTGTPVIWQVDPDLPALISDVLKLKVIFKNLIGNATKFTERGTVTVSAQRYHDGIEVAVADTGIGISPEVLPIIFEPFRQGDSSYTRRHGGVGLGLYIVRRLVDLLRGSISVESELGEGSTFRVWLPIQRRAGIESSMLRPTELN